MAINKLNSKGRYPEFARRIEEARKSYEKGEFISMPADKFLEKLSKC